MKWFSELPISGQILLPILALVYLALAIFMTLQKRGESRGWLFSLLCGVFWPAALWYDAMLIQHEMETYEHKNWSN